MPIDSDCMPFLVFVFMALFILPAAAQSGGKTAADGVFVLDDAEGLNLVASGLQRDWISAYAPAGGLSALSLAGSGLTLAPGQTPVGALRFVVPELYGFLDLGFGVPMPSVAGATTDTYPGNIVDFAALHFLARYSPPVSNVHFQMILETYPEVQCPPDETGPCYPKLHYNFSVTEGTAFQQVTIDLWAPNLVEGPTTLTVADRLSLTRYLAFYVYADVRTTPVSRLTFDLDDLQLEPVTGAHHWELYP